MVSFGINPKKSQAYSENHFSKAFQKYEVIQSMFM